MTSIADILGTQKAQELHQKILADLDLEAKAKPVINQGKKGDIPFVVTKASTAPNPPRRLTAADALHIPKGYSQEYLKAECVDCHTEVAVQVKVPEGTPDLPRVAICTDCTRIRVRFEAIAQQRIDIIHRNKQENNMPQIDLNKMPRAAVGDLVVETMQQREAVKVKKKRAKAVKAKKKEEKVDKKGVKAEQKRRKGHVLPEFKVNDRVTVPTLDLSEVSSLDELANSVQRSPYNKARNALQRGAVALDPDETTYRVLEKEHVRLQQLAAEKAAEKPKKAKKNAKAEPVAVEMDLSDPAVVKALAKHLGVSKKVLLKSLGA